ncbi:MAG: outer membrane lipoprotein carrier protein LolA [Acidobacteriota bacterium]|jgi:outer membrane lipoprotein-sorting protein|nr:outer membrane lipoprotein carrier protein LolA [Acidobacteriota bacterium]
MRFRKTWIWAVLLLGAASFRPDVAAQGAAQGKEGPELAKTLAQIDAVSAKFSSFSAKFTQKRYLALLKEFETPESGEFYYALERKGGDRSVQMRHEVMAPIKRVMTIKGDAATVYQPAMKQAQVYNLGKRKDLVEYLATGLGQSSAKLKEQFTISYAGSEPVGGAPCSVLTLTPKSQSAAASVKSITIWFKKATGTPAQYKFLEPTGDYMLETFSEDTLNGKVPADKFEQKFPKGTEVVKF